MSEEQKDLWSMDTFFDDSSYELDTELNKEDNFFLETNVGEDAEDFFQEFNKPSQVEKKKTKAKKG